MIFLLLRNISEVFRIIITKEGGTKALFRGYVGNMLEQLEIIS